MGSTQLSNTIDVERLIKGVFRDDWMVKSGVGGVLAAGGLVAMMYSWTLLPVLAALWALMIGYCLRCMRVKVEDIEAKLPKWDDWGDLFLSGITWIALQSGIWLIAGALLFLFFAFCLGYAFNEKNISLSSIWTILACVVVLAVSAVITVLSAYVMVNFAIEENAKAGLAFVKVVREFKRNPVQLFYGFFLASGIQFLSVAIPCLTIVGIFLIPSAYFIGLITSSIVLARHWSVCIKQSSD